MTATTALITGATRGIGSEVARQLAALDTNVHGAWRTTLALLPLLRPSPHGRIVNVSSGSGSLAEMGGGVPAYRISKVALDALTRMWAAELRADRVLVNSVCPGWVATDLGGPGGPPRHRRRGRDRVGRHPPRRWSDRRLLPGTRADPLVSGIDGRR